MKIVNIQQMRELEAQAESRGLPSSVLMENAGRASAREIEKVYHPLSGKKIVVLVGPGNNGGDGLVAARYLGAFNAEVAVVLGVPRKLPDKNLELVRQKKIPVIDAGKNFQEVEKLIAASSIVIDALFGTGKARPIEGIYKQMLDKLREQKSERASLRIVSLDLPSGLDADNGFVDPSTCQADLTITMSFPRKGFFTLPGAEYLGQLKIVDIGIPHELAENINIELIDDKWAKSNLPARPLGSHKGTFGKVMVIAGSSRYFGAPYLSCAAAYRAGAGLVTLASIKKVTELVGGKSVETTYVPLPGSADGNIDVRALKIISNNLENCKALLVGPGIGASHETAGFIHYMITNAAFPGIPAVLDADALNLVAKDIQNWWHLLSSNTILTPHPAEFSRLSGLSVAAIQTDRIGKAKEFAARWNKVLVLKGAFTVIANREGYVMVSPWANPALATAGTGDVLAGLISGFLAQGVELFQSAALGVYVHGLAGEMVGEQLGKAGAIASDLLPQIPLAIKKIHESA